MEQSNQQSVIQNGGWHCLFLDQLSAEAAQIFQELLKAGCIYI